MQTFSAPWSGLLKAMSALATIVCLGVPVARHFHGTEFGICLIAIFLAALFIVRGYVITPDAILVKRLFWNTRLPLEGLRLATFAPAALAGSIRTCGNGGFFSFTGWYRNRELGSYRVFLTDRSRAVVLRWDKRIVVVSPDDPERFVQTLGMQSG
jgi:hypothetical protein